MFRGKKWEEILEKRQKRQFLIAESVADDITTKANFKKTLRGKEHRKIRQNLLKFQQGKCAICEKEISGKTAHLDHDHTNDIYRGILCSNCNMGIGSFQDNPELLIKASKYLRINHYILEKLFTGEVLYEGADLNGN